MSRLFKTVQTPRKDFKAAVDKLLLLRLSKRREIRHSELQKMIDIVKRQFRFGRRTMSRAISAAAMKFKRVRRQGRWTLEG